MAPTSLHKSTMIQIDYPRGLEANCALCKRRPCTYVELRCLRACFPAHDVIIRQMGSAGQSCQGRSSQEETKHPRGGWRSPAPTPSPEAAAHDGAEGWKFGPQREHTGESRASVCARMIICVCMVCGSCVYVMLSSSRLFDVNCVTAHHFPEVRSSFCF